MNETRYKDSFKKITKERYGREVDFAVIEGKIQDLKSGRVLTYNDLKIIADDTYWPFTRHWMWPSKEQIKDKLSTTIGWFSNLPKNEGNIIGQLDDIFKNISLVSIILRFAVPEHYGIYSRPNLKILETERGRNDIEEYQNYLNDIRRWKRTLGVSKTADADQAIWAIAQLPPDDELVKAFKEKLPRKLQVNKLLSLQNEPLKVAKEFSNCKDYVTAGLWTALAFEKWIKAICNKYGINPDSNYDNIIKQLCDIDKKYQHKREMLYKTKNIRNNIIHYNPVEPTQIEWFYDNVKKLVNMLDA